MKAAALFLAIVLILVSTVTYANPATHPAAKPKPEQAHRLLCAVQKAFADQLPEPNWHASQQCSKAVDSKLAHQGCCSHHGGVCGCGMGRAVCCDGQYSPSCGCD
jgi:hypothetical protein